MASPASVTEALDAARQGDRGAASRLIALVYQELRRIAHHQMQNVPPGDTLQPTALVHEAYLRLLGRDRESDWENRGHFFHAASRAMRDILVEQSRKHARLKRGGNRKRVAMEEITLASPQTNSEDLLALDEALRALEEADQMSAQVAMLRYFSGLTIDEAAQALGTSPRTVKRRWQYALAWLDRHLFGDERPDGGS
jgi:RNA polymerase sigma factor (TIGR02999 family)